LRSSHVESGLQVITGLGGVSKTQLVTEYAYRHVLDYQAVWWLPAESAAGLAAGYASLATELGLPEKVAEDQRTAIDAVRIWLRHHRDWLLVFDNAPDLESIQGFFPQAGGHILVTSRTASWGGRGNPVRINLLEPFEAEAFLLKRTGQNDHAAAAALASELGNLPLALEQAAAFISESPVSLARYLDLYRTRRLELLEPGRPERQSYPDTVLTTWDISFEHVQRLSVAGAQILEISAFLSPDAIPTSLFREGGAHLPEELSWAAQDDLSFIAAMQAVHRFSLCTIDIERERFSVHRIMQAVVQDRLSVEVRRQRAREALQLVNRAFPYDSDDVRTWTAGDLHIAHADAVTTHPDTVESVPAAARRLSNQMRLYSQGRALFAQARAQLERALRIDEQAYGPDHPNVARDLNNLGSVLGKLGDIEGARRMVKRAFAICERFYGASHPSTRIVQENLERIR
jgi:tetratricopeptide (TPR) repeat protein